MFAVVTDGSITSFPNGNKGIQIGDIKYPAAIYTLWSEAERNAIGVYTVVEDNTNKKNGDWYINTDQSFAFGGGKVTATYGSATAKAIADANAVDADGADLDPVVVIKGLKTKNYAEYTLTCFFVLLLRSNFTTPSINENNVSSLPLDTFLPGCILVPLCRTIIVPANIC